MTQRTIPTETATSWTDALERLYADDWRDDLGRNRSRYAFRGVAKSAYVSMETSLMRLGEGYAGMERHLLRNFRKYAHRDVAERDSLWSWLSIGQHHGLPTRLLDWTYSPLVALHFATDKLESMEQDAAVVMVDIDDAHAKLPSPISEFDRNEASVFTVDMLSRFDIGNHKPQKGDGILDFALGKIGSILVSHDGQMDELGRFDKMASSDFCLFFEPSSIDDRIVNQFGLFSIISNTGTTMKTWLENNPDVKSKIVIIPAGVKWQIRDRLDQANISERVIYPGLGGISQWLKRHYTQKRKPQREQ